MGARLLPTTLDNGTLSRHLIYYNRIITTINVSHQPDSRMTRARPPFPSHSSSLSFLHLMKEQKEDMVIHQNKEDEFWSKGFTLFIDGRESELSLIQIFNPQKVGPRLKIFGQPNQQKINCRRQNTIPYPPSHYDFWIWRDTGSNSCEI